jgi:hypothetical protein
MGWVFLELKCGVWKAELISHPPSTKGLLDGGAEFIATVKWLRYVGKATGVGA